jgi:hypothetical protein
MIGVVLDCILSLVLVSLKGRVFEVSVVEYDNQMMTVAC